VGINRVDDPAAKRGYRLVGDVAFEKSKWLRLAHPGARRGGGPDDDCHFASDTVKGAQRAAGLL
jgi:hypothetical protein